MLPLALLLASTATAHVGVRIEAQSVRIERGILTLPSDSPPPPRPRVRACPTRDPAPPGCRLIVFDLP